MTRRLVVNADDLGQSPGINRGVFLAHLAGIVTSASFMVRSPAAEEAAALAAQSASLSVGLHVDLGQWSYVNDEWVADYELVDTDDPAAVEREVLQQLDAFRQLLGRDPTHLDGHQHVQRTEPVRTVLRMASRDLGVPLRLFSPVRYCGAFYGQTDRGLPYPDALTVEALLAVVAELDAGWHELGCHPGIGDDAPGSYRTERSVELAVLCDPSLPSALEAMGVRLCSFSDWHAASCGG